MRHLWEDWPGLLRRIQRAQGISLFLDYDGTLAPIAPTPAEALCPAGVKVLLGRLREAPRVSLTVVSGRSLGDLSEKVGVQGILYVGNHGLEFRNPAGVHRKKLSAPREKEMRGILWRLRRSLRGVPGALVEEKGPIAAVHYRNVAREDLPRVRRALKEALESREGRWKTARGKKVTEIRPPGDFHKGRAVKEILRGAPRGTLPIYLGDDRTDEDAFLELKGRGVCVFVGTGRGTSQAEYFLAGPEEVEEFLERLAGALEGTPGGSSPGRGAAEV